MVDNSLIQGCVLELRSKSTHERKTLHVRHTFADLVRCVDQAIDENMTLTVIPYSGSKVTIDPDEYRALAVFHYNEKTHNAK